MDTLWCSLITHHSLVFLVVLFSLVQFSTTEGPAEQYIPPKVPKPLAIGVDHYTYVHVFGLYSSLGFLIHIHPCNPGLTVP